MTAHLQALVKSYDKEGKPAEWVRQPTKQEWDYINNERIVCKYDFSYWALRYAYINLLSIDGRDSGVGRLGSVGFMRPQTVFLSKIAASEEKLYEQRDKGYPVDGIRYFINKSRQQHFTAMCRILNNHRTFHWPDTQAIGASVNDDMVHELYSRDKIMYDRLPWFMKPDIGFDVKDAQLSFKGLGSETLYHQANQHGGLGTGRSIKVAHMTECSLWDDMVGAGTLQDKLDNQLFPAIPQDIQTIYLLESSPNGLGGWWWKQIQLVLRGKSLFDLYFCGWYVSDKKNRREPPIGWEPSDYTKGVAERVERTSASYLGFTVRLDRQQMYWHESTMTQHEGRLGEFFTNFATDLDESFQAASGAFSLELVRDLRAGLGSLHGAYDITEAA